MNHETISFFWEAAKTVVPAILAWWLSVRTANKKAESNRIELREQLKIQKDNNLTVQNKAYRLQFGLEKLNEYEMLSEKMFQQFHLMKRYFDDDFFINNDFEDLMTAKRDTEDFLSTAQEFFHYFALIQVTTKAVNPNALNKCEEVLDEFQTSVEGMSPAFRKVVHDTDHFLNNRGSLDSSKMHTYITQMKKNVHGSRTNMDNLLESLKSLRDFLVEMVQITYGKLN